MTLSIRDGARFTFGAGIAVLMFGTALTVINTILREIQDKVIA